MSKIPSTQRITVEELQGDPTQMIRALLRPLNLFIEDVNSALNKNITISDNLDSSIVSVQIQTPSTYPTDFNNTKFQHGMKRRVNGNVVLNISDDEDSYAVFTDPVQANISFDTTQGEIKHITGLAANKFYTLTFLIL